MDHTNPPPNPISTDFTGSGAIAQDHSIAAGQGAIAIGGDVTNSTIVLNNVFQGVHHVWPIGLRLLPTEPIPVERYAQLREEFQEGGGTRAEHILADLDFRREAKLAEITKAFLHNHVVIIHAASGQGKTTLAYRYLYNYHPAGTCFTVDRIQDIQHALNIANALGKQGSDSQTPLLIYIDVHPQDTAWTELVTHLARHPNIYALVTLREEDFKRTNVSSREFTFASIDLAFDEHEARLIYARTQPTRFLTFEDAWDAFHDKWLLMEFIYLLTHTTTLRERLAGQVFELRREVERGYRQDKLRILMLVAVASAYEARLQTEKLILALDLADPDHTLKALEAEYLLRRNQTEYSIGGLHALRSQILVDLLTSPDTRPWLLLAKQVLPLLVEEDLELFLLHAFVEHPDHINELLQTTQLLRPATWRGAASILRCLLWSGVRAYIETNRGAIEDARALMARAWYFIIPLNFTGDDAPDVREAWKNLEGIIPKENLDHFAEIYSRLTPGTDALSYATTWLMQLTQIVHKPANVTDWAGVAELLYWSSRVSQPHVLDFLKPVDLFATVSTLPLTICGQLSASLFIADAAQHKQWLDRTRDVIAARLAHEEGIVYLEEQDDLLKIHFISAFQENEQDPEKPVTPRPSDPIHAMTMARILLVRKLFPMYARYGAQGYGQKLLALGLDLDSTEKPGIVKKYLPLEWGVRLNGIAVALVDYGYRLDTWDQYVQHLLELRQHIVTSLEQLRKGLGHYLESKRAVDIQRHFIDSNQWQACFLQVNEPPGLPKIAVDRWGLGTEGRIDSSSESRRGQSTLRDENSNINQRLVSKALALQIYQPFLKAQQEYLSSLRNFMMQSRHVMVVNAVSKKLLTQLDPNTLNRVFDEFGIKTTFSHLSTSNLWQAKQTLAEFQVLFRQYFGQRIETTVLDALEKTETKLLSHIWQLWYFYASSPEQVMIKSFRDVPQKIVEAHQRFDHRIQQALQRASMPGVSATRLNISLGWDGATALWITLDIAEPVNLYHAYEHLVVALQSALTPLKPQDIEYFLLREKFEFTVIVPLVRGRLVSDQAFPLCTLTTLVSEKKIVEAVASFAIQPLAGHYIAALGLERWTSSVLSTANQFIVSVASLVLLAAQVAEFYNLPDVFTYGEDALKTYLKSQATALSQCGQGYLDARTVLLDQFNSLPASEQAERPYLCAAVAKLAEIHNFVWPSQGKNEIFLDLEQLVVYAEKLTEIYHDAESIRLLWITDALDYAIDISDIAQ